MAEKNEQLFIPKKINVGCQWRNDTYTGKLGYIIYWDNKGVLRKEKSWKDWIHDKPFTDKVWEPKTTGGGEWKVVTREAIPIQDFNNEPTEGFVLNKDVGGTRHSYGSWNARIEKVRVYDPRGFEFEISIPNLLFILNETSSIPGKGLGGQFVYSWSGPELVLLPCVSQEYKKCVNFTKLQDGKVTKKDLVPGCVYKTKKEEEIIYLGTFKWIDKSEKRFDGPDPNDRYSRYYNHHYKRITQVTNEMVFTYVNPKKVMDYGGDKHFTLKALTSIAEKVSDEPVPNYAHLMDGLQKNPHISRAVGLELGKIKKKINWEKYENTTEPFDVFSSSDKITSLTPDGKIIRFNISPKWEWDRKNIFKGYKPKSFEIIDMQNDDVVKSAIQEQNSLYQTIEEVNELPNFELFVVLENGQRITYTDYKNFFNKYF